MKWTNLFKFLVPCGLILGTVWWAHNRTQPRLRNVTSGEILQTDGSVVSLAFSPDGKTLVAGTHARGSAPRWGGSLVVWDIGSDDPARTIPQEQWVNSVAVSPDGNTLALGCGIANYASTPDFGGYSDKPGKVKVLNLKTLAVVASHETQRGVFGVAFSPDGRLLAVASGGKSGEPDTVELLRAADLRPQKVLKGPFSLIFGHLFYCAMAFHPNSQSLAVGEGAMLSAPAKARLRIWNFEEGTDLSLEDIQGAVTSLCFVADGQSLAVVDGIVRLYEVADYRKKRALGGHARLRNERIAASPDSKFLVVAGNSGGPSSAHVAGAVVWDLATEDVWAEIELRKPPSSIACVTFAPDSQTLVTGSWDGSVRFWKLKKP